MELLEIERELAGAEKDAALAKYDGMLVALGERLRVALSKGVPPSDYRKFRELAEAAVVARKLLRLQVRNTKKI